MSKLDDLRQAVIEAEQNLVAEWPAKGPTICRQLQESRGKDFAFVSGSHIQDSFVEVLKFAWKRLNSGEVEELVAHRKRVAESNAKVGA